MSFLTRAELSYVDTKEKFRSSLYKVLLFKHIVSAIKGDSLSLLDSYRFRNLDAYLIPTTKWQSHRDTLLRQAEMSAYANVDEVLDECAAENHRQFQETNVHIATDQNGYVQSDGLGGYKLLSERNTSKEALAIEAESVELYPNDNLVSLSEVLNTVNTATGYLDEFHHHQQRYLKDRPETKLFIAATQGIACHLGTPRMIKASKSLGDATTTLETVANHYFHLEAARKASDRIVEYTAKLPVSSLIKSDFGTQTSSDGQKWTVAHDSLNANYSFKYGGKDMVISAYSFIDYRNLFFHSEVISGSEREAHYMIDGVLRNRVVKSDMHSTDTHGYTEAVFGTAHLLNISFAPRMRNVPKQHLYAFKPRRTYAQLDYTILPKGRINIKLIKRHWDEILRLLVSIKLGETSASQVFKRLNSYAKDDNPLYLALKEFGRIPKTLYLYVIWNCCRTMIFANSRDRLVALA